MYKWSTPQLIVHGGKDYRLAETEGLSAFNALQQCVSGGNLVICDRDSVADSLVHHQAWRAQSLCSLPGREPLGSQTREQVCLDEIPQHNRLTPKRTSLQLEVALRGAAMVRRVGRGRVIDEGT